MHKTRRVLGCLLAVAILLPAGGCSSAGTSAKPDAPKSKAGASSSPGVQSGLEELFGSRLGRTEVNADGVLAEVQGAATDAQLASVLLSSSSSASSTTITVTLADPAADWSTSIMQWDCDAGSLVRMHGTGDESMFIDYAPGDGRPGLAFTAFYDGQVASGVSESMLRSFAAGKRIPWAPYTE